MSEKNAQVKRTRVGALGAVGLVAVIAIAAIWFKVVKGGSERGEDLATFAARRGPLTISVLESGTIKAKDQTIIKNEVEGRRSIIFLVEEGTHIKVGDLLVELDSGSLKDSKIDQEILVQNASADLVDAQENQAVVENQGKSDIDKATLTLEFAKQDLQQYTVDDGLFAKEVTELDARISLADEELRRAQDVNDWSSQLYKEKYISQTEYQADSLKVRLKQLELDVTQSDLRILKKFTYERRIAELTSDVSQAEMALERIEGRARADNKQAEAKLKAREAEYNRQQAKLEKIVQQIEKCKITAPADGLVIYATSAQRNPFSNQQPLDEGQEVRERQELIYLPRSDSVMAEVDVHEANLHKVRPGLPVIITLDALPGERFFGTVRQIAPLPYASMPLAPDLKVYKAEVDLQADNSMLRTGMSCRTEIIVAQHEEAVYVPVQAVLNVGGNPTAYILKDQKPAPRRVTIGLDNNRMVHVKKGLEEGELVLLAPPLDAASVEASSDSDPNALEGASDEMGDKVREQLKTSTQSPAQPPAQPGGSQGTGPGQAQTDQKPGPQGQSPKGTPNLSPEQMEQVQKMQKLLKNMSEEEREKLKNMSIEERVKFLEEKMQESQ